jgi:hypothetical protein
MARNVIRNFKGEAHRVLMVEELESRVVPVRISREASESHLQQPARCLGGINQAKPTESGCSGSYRPNGRVVRGYNADTCRTQLEVPV